jgi:tripeptide aminopeptidase
MINQDRLIKTFLELVQIDSPSGEEEAMAKELAKRLEALGGKSERDAYGNLFVHFEGEGEPLMVNAHMDTVEPGRGIKPIIEGDIIKTDGSTVLGGDPKSGVAAILEAVESIKEDNAKHLPIEAVFTREEETGLLGAVNLDYSKLKAKRGVTFDGGEEVHIIHSGAPGYNRVDITITGRGAHAGAEPEKGLSAIKIAADLINLLEIGRIDEETTANIGLIEGGSARNAVPETVILRGEIRSRNLEKLEKHGQHFKDVITKVQEKYPEAKIDLEMEREFDPYQFEDSHPMIQHVSQAFKEIGVEPKLQPSGGGTDVNIFHTHGIEAVVVGDGDYEAHTKREYVVISQMLNAAKFCEKLLRLD